MSVKDKKRSKRKLKAEEEEEDPELGVKIINEPGLKDLYLGKIGNGK